MALDALDLEDEFEDEEEAECRVCGCTEMRACPGGCLWVEHNLCSRCVKAAKR